MWKCCWGWGGKSVGGGRGQFSHLRPLASPALQHLKRDPVVSCTGENSAQSPCSQSISPAGPLTWNLKWKTSSFELWHKQKFHLLYVFILLPFLCSTFRNRIIPRCSHLRFTYLLCGGSVLPLWDFWRLNPSKPIRLLPSLVFSRISFVSCFCSYTVKKFIWAICWLLGYFIHHI